jgi:hypothetical protein
VIAVLSSTSACTMEPATEEDLAAELGGRRCVPADNRFNCTPPETEFRHGPRVLRSVADGDIRWPIHGDTHLFDGFGNDRGVVTESSVKINYGQRKRLHGRTVVYAWDVRTTGGAASGWIFEEKIVHRDRLRDRSPTLELPNPGHGEYDTIWVITGGNNASFEGLKVNPDVGHATDYLLRPGNVVNIVYSVPGFHLGGFSVDTVPPGVVFRRSRGVEQIRIELYDESNRRVNRYMHFVYGFIHDGTQRRYGWMAKEALAQVTGLHRYWNPTNGDHFYTVDRNDRGLAGFGYVNEGTEGRVFRAQETGTVPLYRYWNPTNGDHFYTTNWGELGAGSLGYSFERVEAYVYPVPAPSLVPLHRYWNPFNADHFYTIHANHDGLAGFGYSYEGVTGYVVR